MIIGFSRQISSSRHKLSGHQVAANKPNQYTQRNGGKRGQEQQLNGNPGAIFG